MRKITFSIIDFILQKIKTMMRLKIIKSIFNFFGFKIKFLLGEPDSTPDLSKGDCKVIQLEKFQKEGKIPNDRVNVAHHSIDSIPPEIRQLIIYNIMDAFSKKLPTPYHQRKIMRIGKANSHRNEKYQILQNLN